jgi:hypothetical protein
MGFTPPPEKVVRFTSAAILTPEFLAALRGGAFEGGGVRADGSDAVSWPAIEEGRWALTREEHMHLTLATYCMVVDGEELRDGSVFVEGHPRWLCAVELADGTHLAVAVPVPA